VLLLSSVALLLHVRSFPTVPGQQFGAALFPALIGVGFGVCGLLLVVSGWRAHARDAASARWFTPPPWARSPRQVIALAAVIAVNVAYIALVDVIGFVPLAIAYLALLFWVFGVPAKWMLPIAVVVALVIHYAFYKLLRVPLPWGVLQRFAW
jgi:putative tricarboxylic transport membrane protein